MNTSKKISSLTEYLAEQYKMNASVYKDFIFSLMMVFLDKLFKLYILIHALTITTIHNVRILKKKKKKQENYVFRRKNSAGERCTFKHTWD